MESRGPRDRVIARAQGGWLLHRQPYVVGVELFYSYANLVMNMMRVHDQGFVDHIDHQHAMHSHVPAALQADLPLLTFPVNLFRWGWIVFQARQKRRYN